MTMNLKTSIKTGGRDVLRGFLAMRPDIYGFIAGVLGFTWLTMVYVLTQHDGLTEAEAVEMMRALGNGVLLVAAFPIIVAVIWAAVFAIGRRTRWAPKFRWDHEKYITVEEHQAEMRRLRDEVEGAAVEELRRELASQDGGDE